MGDFSVAIFAAYKSAPNFRPRRALKPLYTDAESFELLVQQVSSFSAGILGQAVGSVAPFARELFSVKEFRNDRLHMPAPDPYRLVENVCQNLISTRFGRA